MAKTNGATGIETEFEQLQAEEKLISDELGKLEAKADELRARRNVKLLAFLAKYGKRKVDRHGRETRVLPVFMGPDGVEYQIIQAYSGKEKDAKLNAYIRRIMPGERPTLASLHPAG